MQHPWCCVCIAIRHHRVVDDVEPEIRQMLSLDLQLLATARLEALEEWQLHHMGEKDVTQDQRVALRVDKAHGAAGSHLRSVAVVSPPPLVQVSVISNSPSALPLQSNGMTMRSFCCGTTTNSASRR